MRTVSFRQGTLQEGFQAFSSWILLDHDSWCLKWFTWGTKKEPLSHPVIPFGFLGALQWLTVILVMPIELGSIILYIPLATKVFFHCSNKSGIRPLTHAATIFVNIGHCQSYSWWFRFPAITTRDVHLQYMPGTWLSSILVLESFSIRSFPNKTGVPIHFQVYKYVIYIYYNMNIYICNIYI